MAETTIEEAGNAIRERALLRVAGVFRISVETLRPEHIFGVDLKPSFVSDFRRNELDQIDDDIHDVADRAVAKQFESGQLVIRTVRDYCDHLIRCSQTKPKEVERIFELDEKQRQRSTASVKKSKPLLR